MGIDCRSKGLKCGQMTIFLSIEFSVLQWILKENGHFLFKITYNEQ